MKTRNDIAFYLKMYPILQLHPEAYAKSKAIVCEEDNEKAIRLLEDVYAKKRIKAPQCDTNVIDENIRLAGKLRITGTPTLVFPDGIKVSGAMDAAKLLGLIQKHGG